MRRPATGGRLVHYLVAACIVSAAAALVWQSIASKPPRRVDVATATGPLNLELATTPDQRAAGLSNRDTMTTDALLLLWPEPARHPIWMKNMRFALDIAWFDAEGRVLAVMENVPPCAARPLPPVRTARNRRVDRRPRTPCRRREETRYRRG